MPRRVKKVVPFRLPREVSGEREGNIYRQLTQHHTTPRKLSFGERKLADWLRQRFGMIGAKALVRQYGGKAVVEQLHDGIMYDNGFQWVVEPGIRNAGAFLRYLLENQAGE